MHCILEILCGFTDTTGADNLGSCVQTVPVPFCERSSVQVFLVMALAGSRFAVSGTHLC